MEPISKTGGGRRRKEALLNEYKGNLYEYLAALFLARLRSGEAGFARSVDSRFYTMLEQQESFVREYYPALLKDLPELAQGLAQKLHQALPPDCSQIKLVGKSAASLAAGELGEADILASGPDGRTIPVSIKLSRADAFVNTKSGGVKSFISKYFYMFPAHRELQEKLSRRFDREFATMAFRLCELAGIEADASFETWRAAGLSELPGELPSEMREVFLDFLYGASNKLCELMESLRAQDPALFGRCLLPLMGHSREDMFQATTFYHPQGEGYRLQSHVVEFAGDLADLEVEAVRNRESSSSFDLLFKDRIAQIRLKAMNKFTAKGFKVNCAVKLI